MCTQLQRYLSLQYETDKHVRGDDQSEPNIQGAEEGIHWDVVLVVEPNDGNADCIPHDSEKINHKQQCQKEDISTPE